MARVIATGGVPQHDFGRGLQGLGENLLKFSQVREMQAQREATNAFAQALQQSAAPQVAADGTVLEPSPMAKAFQGMEAPQLAAYLRANPHLIRDPQKMAQLMRAGEDYEFRTVNDSLVRIGKTTGKVEEIFKGNRQNRHDFKVIGNALYKVDKESGEAKKLFEENEAVKPQDALSKLTSDFRSGFISREDFAARRRMLTERESDRTRGTVGGPGGSVIDKETGEVLVPGRINVVGKDGEERTVAFSSRKELEDITQKLNAGELIETSKGGRQPGSDLGAKQRANLRVKRQEGAKNQLSKDTGGLLQFAQTLKQVREAPLGAFGARGNIARGIAGLVGQVDPQTANALAGLVSGGATQEDLSQLRTNARALIAATIPVATGEEGTDRISNAERAIAEETLGMFSTLSNQQQAVAALQQLMVLKLAGIERMRLEAGLKPEFDFEKLADVKRLHQRYMAEYGMDDATAKKAIRLQRDVRREVAPLFADE